MEIEQKSGCGPFLPVGIRFCAEFQLPLSNLGELPRPEFGNDALPLIHSNPAQVDCASGFALGLEEFDYVSFEHAPMLNIAYMESKNGLQSVDYPGAMETMGDRIRLLRQSKGLTQEQLGQRLGVSKVAVSQWETGGTSNVRLKTFLALVEELGTTYQYLLFGPKQQAPSPKRRTGG
jgi:DNA-binding XRE family transcriptional regulator